MSMGMNERHLKMEDNMGAFSKLFRYRERGQEANANNVEEYGTPAHSLFISTKFWSFTQKTEITDEDGKVAYRAKSRAISLHDKTWVTDAKNKNVAEIDRKVLTLKEYHRVKMADGNSFDIAHDFFQLYKDTARIPELGWQIRGNILSLGGTATMSPISYFYDKYSHKGKMGRLYNEMLSYNEEMERIQQKYNRDIVSELTGLQGDELLDFMMYCHFNYYDLVRWSDEQIREKIRANYFNYQYDRIANEKQ